MSAATNDNPTAIGTTIADDVTNAGATSAANTTMDSSSGMIRRPVYFTMLFIALPVAFYLK